MADNELSAREVLNGLIVTGAKPDKGLITEAGGFVVSNAAGEWGMGAYTGSRTSPTHDGIAELAHHLYVSRGRQDGYHIEDWLLAEQQLVHHYA